MPRAFVSATQVITKHSVAGDGKSWLFAGQNHRCGVTLDVRLPLPSTGNGFAGASPQITYAPRIHVGNRAEPFNLEGSKPTVAVSPEAWNIHTQRRIRLRCGRDVPNKHELLRGPLKPTACR